MGIFIPPASEPYILEPGWSRPWHVGDELPSIPPQLFAYFSSQMPEPRQYISGQNINAQFDSVFAGIPDSELRITGQFGDERSWIEEFKNDAGDVIKEKEHTYIHAGTDLGAPIDSHGSIEYPPVVFPILSGGVAGRTEDGWPYGNSVIIETAYPDLPPEIQEVLDPDESLYINYAHLQDSPVPDLGQLVLPDVNPLGIMGNTGNSEGIHLHIEARVGESGTIFGSMNTDDEATIDEEASYSLWRNDNEFEPFNLEETWLGASDQSIQGKLYMRPEDSVLDGSENFLNYFSEEDYAFVQAMIDGVGQSVEEITQPQTVMIDSNALDAEQDVMSVQDALFSTAQDYLASLTVKVDVKGGSGVSDQAAAQFAGDVASGEMPAVAQGNGSSGGGGSTGGGGGGSSGGGASPWVDRGGGIAIFADGGLSAGGLALVGEEGPELVNLPPGALVKSAPMTRALLPGLASGGGEVNNVAIHVDFHGVADARGAQELVDVLRRELRAQGMDFAEVR